MDTDAPTPNSARSSAPDIDGAISDFDPTVPIPPEAPGLPGAGAIGDAHLADEPAGATQDVVGAASRPGTGRMARRGLIYLGLCLAFGAALLASMLLGGAAAGTAATCGGAVISQAALVPDPAGSPHLFAIVRPPAFPNVALGGEPGCQMLYRSDDEGITWTVAFSATAEAPAAVLPAGPSRLYLLTQRLQFPLSNAGNLYRSDSLGAAWTWQRISPQNRHAVPRVSASDMLVQSGGAVILHESNGDGATLIRSNDGGLTWQPVLIPGLPSVASAAVAGSLLAVAPARFTPGRAPALASGDGGATWSALGRLPRAPVRRDLVPVLAADPVERTLLMSLVPAAAVVPDHPVARYASLDEGATWHVVRCGARPASGCAPPARWAQGAAARYVLYRRRIFRALPGARWQPMTASLPVRSDTVLQLLAAPAAGGDRLYLVTATGIWRLDGRRWRSISTGLSLGGPGPVAS